MRLPSAKKYLLLFILLLSAVMLLQSINDPFFVIKEIKYFGIPYDFRGFIKMFLYFGGYVFTVISLLAILTIQSEVLFIVMLLSIVVFYTTDLFIQLIGTSHGFSKSELMLMINEVGETSALIAYLNYIAYAFLIALLFGVLLYFMRKRYIKEKISSFVSIIIIVIGFLGIYIPVKITNSITYTSFPAYSKIPILFIDYLKKPSQIKDRILGTSIVPTNESKYQNIIWIVDESITGSYLSINGYSKETTPYLDSLNKNSKKIVNFGLVNSVSNCSSPSNLYLRIGLNPKINNNYDTDVLNLPTVFQFAKRAGYTTWLLDAQASKDTLQDGLTLYDKQHIDHFVTLDTDTDPKTRDKKLLATLEHSLDNKKKNFIVFVKFGAHWPYLLSYDTKKSIFNPILESTIGGMTLENKDKQINTYLNSINYSTDEFLKDLIGERELNNTIVFYTSDHGQNILEKGSSRTHCNTENIVKNEVTVPLFIFTDNAKGLFSIENNLSYSQIQIFPTTLDVLGYDNKIVRKYGKTLNTGYDNNDSRKYWITSTGKKGIYK